MRSSQNLGARLLTGYPFARGGLWILIWKSWLQSWRKHDFKGVILWLALFGLSIGMMLAYGQITLVGVFIIWGLLIDHLCLKRLSSDLSHWVLFCQLPFSGQEILLSEIVSPALSASLFVWLAYGIVSLIGSNIFLPYAILAPGIILCIILTAAFDLIRQCKTEALLAGHSPQQGALGLYLGLILGGLPLAMVIWLTGGPTSTGLMWGISILGLVFSLGLAFGLWKLAAFQLTKIK